MVSLEIGTYSIEDPPPYIALAYTWGDANDVVPVLCNGRVLAVTANLEKALWQFREDRKRLVRAMFSKRSHSQLLHFWVDAICINQTNRRRRAAKLV